MLDAISFTVPLTSLKVGLQAPAWLGLWLLLPVLGWLAKQQFSCQWQTMLHTHVLASLAWQASPAPRREVVWPLATWLVSIALLALALAQPVAWVLKPERAVRVMLVQDISLSMLATDMPPNRLTVAKQAALRFVQSLPPEVEVGLAMFAGNVSLPVLPTRNHAEVEAQLRHLSEADLQTNTALGSALQQAGSALVVKGEGDVAQPEALGQLLSPQAAGGQVANVIVLLSDGDSFTGQPWQQVVPWLHQQGIKVITLGLGGSEPTFITYQGETYPVELNEVALQAIAQQTEGQYFKASHAEGLAKVYGQLGQATLRWVRQPVPLQAGLLVVMLLLQLVWAWQWLRPQVAWLWWRQSNRNASQPKC
jgi:Ca-activated chloride channel family protein